MIYTFSAIVTSWLLATGVVPLRAQSLADVARAEEARRKDAKQSPKVITNKDLTPVAPPATPSTTDGVAPADGADKSATKDKAATKDQKAGVDGTAKDKDTAGEATKEKVKDQAYWSKRMKDLQTQLDRDETFAEALQTRINALTADFSARDDPAQRAVIGANRQKALAELERLKKAIQADKTAIADLQEEARRASVPPGWLR
jgi:DNA repair exonuclease SbcCD ATPase subunit